MSPWFSLEISREAFPWVYARGNKPALLISTLEALAVLMAPIKLSRRRSRKQSYTSHTCPYLHRQQGERLGFEQANEHKVPFICTPNGIVAFLKKREIKASAEWAPRESNREADPLANGVTVDFNRALEMKVGVEKFQWCLVPDALEAGRQAEGAYRKAKEQGHCRTERRRRDRRDLRTGFGRRIRGEEPRESNRNVNIISQSDGSTGFCFKLFSSLCGPRPRVKRSFLCCVFLYSQVLLRAGCFGMSRGKRGEEGVRLLLHLWLFSAAPQGVSSTAYMAQFTT